LLARSSFAIRYFKERREMMKRKREGFTLIELLIVVAIIAILAAIAVPNFLEAQTRSKVSRVMSDMRSIAVANECYTVDYNRPAPDMWDWDKMGRYDYADPEWQDWVLAPLTTPVAYLTSIPKDPFAAVGPGPAYRLQMTHARYITSTGVGNGNSCGETPDDPAAFFYGPRSNYRWLLDSPGPDFIWEFFRWPTGPSWAGSVVYYDATNGTKSQGDIYYYGPGGGINPGPVTSR
jgi:prepilin-type N-terminal cleavage/methylation domain-containing protein